MKAEGTYAYVSMGGKHLVDQESVYRRIGIRNLFSFDGSADVIDRTLFNRQLCSAICVKMHSGALAAEIAGILARFQAGEYSTVWLDHTNHLERLSHNSQ